METLRQTLQWGGSLGMIGVILFVFCAPIIGGFAATNVIVPRELENGVFDRSLPAEVIEGAALVAHLLTPMIFLALFAAFRDLMRFHAWILADWLYGLAVLSMGFWMLKGGILVFMLPAAPLVNDLTLTPVDLARILGVLNGGLLDLAYWVLSVYLVVAGYFIRRLTNKNYLGNQIIVIGVSMFPILLFGPYSKVNLLGIYGYGAPIFALFSLSVFMLRHADTFPNQTKPTK